MLKARNISKKAVKIRMFMFMNLKFMKFIHEHKEYEI